MNRAMNGFIKIVGVTNVCGGHFDWDCARVAESAIVAVAIEGRSFRLMLAGGHIIEARCDGNEAILNFAAKGGGSA